MRNSFVTLDGMFFLLILFSVALHSFKIPWARGSENDIPEHPSTCDCFFWPTDRLPEHCAEWARSEQTTLSMDIAVIQKAAYGVTPRRHVWNYLSLQSLFSQFFFSQSPTNLKCLDGTWTWFCSDYIDHAWQLFSSLPLSFLIKCGAHSHTKHNKDLSQFK